MGPTSIREMGNGRKKEGGGRTRREKKWGGRFGAGRGQKEGGRTERGGNEEKRKRGGNESWNRAAEWLRPASYKLPAVLHTLTEPSKKKKKLT